MEITCLLESKTRKHRLPFFRELSPHCFVVVNREKSLPQCLQFSDNISAVNEINVQQLWIKKSLSFLFSRVFLLSLVPHRVTTNIIAFNFNASGKSFEPNRSCGNE